MIQATVISNLLIDFFAAVIAALLMGYAAHRCRLPTVVGYLAAGILIGPHTPGFASDQDLIRSLAEIGIAFLLFAVGTSLPMHDLRQIRKVAAASGLITVVLTVLLGALIARPVAANWAAAFFFAALLANSSTTIVVRLLMDRHELASLHGHAAVTISLVQDLLIASLFVLVPILAPLSGPSPSILLAIGKIVALVAAIPLGILLIPRLLDGIAATGSDELFLFAIISIALGSAIGTQLLGMSAAVGAFVAGMAIANARFAGRIQTVFAPFRDLFSIFFFISVGMLFDPRIISEQPAAVATTVFLVIAGKIVLGAVVVRLLGYGRRHSFLIGVYLAQVSELSFILAGVGRAHGLIDTRLYTLLVASVVGSIFASPFLVQHGPRLFDWAYRRKAFRPMVADPP